MSPGRDFRVARCVLFLAGVAACGAAQVPQAPPPAVPSDLVFVDGDVWTMDPARPRAQAVAIQGGRIQAVGSDQEVRAFVGASTRVIDLDGASLVPGLTDGHCHLYGLGADLENVSVRDSRTPEEAAQRVKVAAPQREGEWILGRGWDQNKWAGQQFPHRAILDAAIGQRPVVLRRIDGHASWVNSEALRRAGITRSTPDPAGGKIVRDDRGEPTGVLVDNAMDLVDVQVPSPGPADRRRRIARGAQVAVSLGLTGVHEMGIDRETEAVYRAMASEDLAAPGGPRQLPLRVYAYLAGDPATAEALRTAPVPGLGRFEMRGVKFFVDGALGSRGARLIDDYSDDAGNRGLWVAEPAQLQQAVSHAAQGGWQVAVHAIGDAGARAVIEAFEAVQRRSPADRRWRVEHTQVIALEDIPRMARGEIIASMQPTHATSDMPWAEARVGRERIRGAYAWRRILEAGVTLVAGSDFPVEEVSPLLGLYAAVTRQDPQGSPEGGWYPDQRLSLQEALEAFTVAPAYAAFAEKAQGRLLPGLTADLTVFDRPLLPTATLLETRAQYTVVAGEIVYDAAAHPAAP